MPCGPERAAGGRCGGGPGLCPRRAVPRRGCRDASVPPIRVPERRAEPRGRSGRPSRLGCSSNGSGERSRGPLTFNSEAGYALNCSRNARDQRSIHNSSMVLGSTFWKKTLQ
nr:CDC42 small effector protein 2 isoform X1 [Taeniopygia guttata]